MAEATAGFDLTGKTNPGQEVTATFGGVGAGVTLAGTNSATAGADVPLASR